MDRNHKKRRKKVFRRGDRQLNYDILDGGFGSSLIPFFFNSLFKVIDFKVDLRNLIGDAQLFFHFLENAIAKIFAERKQFSIWLCRKTDFHDQAKPCLK